MADSIVGSWWARLRGRLRPSPCPFSQGWILEMPLRRWFAGAKRILGAFGLERGERLLEIGPGIGYYSLPASQVLGEDGALICLDIQRQMLEAVRRRLAGRAPCRLLLVRADALRLPLRAGCADRAMLITVLGELPDRGRGLAEIHRVLRDGGRLSISEQLPDPDFIPLGTLRRELRAAGFAEERTRGRLSYASTWLKRP